MIFLPARQSPVTVASVIACLLFSHALLFTHARCWANDGGTTASPPPAQVDGAIDYHNAKPMPLPSADIPPPSPNEPSNHQPPGVPGHSEGASGTGVPRDPVPKTTRLPKDAGKAD